MVPSNGTRGFALFTSQAPSPASKPPTTPPDAQPLPTAQAVPAGDDAQVRTEVALPAVVQQSWLERLRALATSLPSGNELSPFPDPVPPGFEQAALSFVLSLFEPRPRNPEPPGSAGGGGAPTVVDSLAEAAKSGLVAAIAVGAPFGAAFRGAGMWALSPHPVVRGAARLAPLVAAAVTPAVGSAVTGATGFAPSKTSSLWQDAAAPLGIFVVSLLNRRFVPPGALATVLGPVVGSFVGGATQAVAVQASLPGARSGEVRVTTRDQALGNVVVVAPHVAANALGKNMPWIASMLVLLGGWTFRNEAAHVLAQRLDGGAGASVKKECPLSSVQQSLPAGGRN